MRTSLLAPEQGQAKSGTVNACLARRQTAGIAPHRWNKPRYCNVSNSIHAVTLRTKPYLPIGLAVLACVSPGRFAGLSGWLGFAGFMLLAATLWASPTLYASKPRFPPGRQMLPAISFTAALLLIIASVVVWASAS